MKLLVTYLSQTGNTKKVAEAIYGELSGDKELQYGDFAWADSQRVAIVRPGGT